MGSEGEHSSVRFHQVVSLKGKAGPILKLICHILKLICHVLRYPGLFLPNLGPAKGVSGW